MALLRCRAPALPVAWMLVGALLGLGRNPGRAAAPIVSSQSVYAAFTLNLTRFITWPEQAFSAKNAPLIIGTFTRDPINSELDVAVAGESVGEHPIQTMRLRSIDDVAKCHVVFVSRSFSRIAAVLERARGKSILTISDADGFIELGGHVRFVPQATHVRLSVSASNLKASHLEARAQLLRAFAETP